MTLAWNRSRPAPQPPKDPQGETGRCRICGCLDDERFIAAMSKRRKGVCRDCGCVDGEACPGGCGWTDETKTLCSRCEGHTPAEAEACRRDSLDALAKRIGDAQNAAADLLHRVGVILRAGSATRKRGAAAKKEKR